MITFSAEKAEHSGLVQGLFVSSFEPKYAPLFIWLDNKCARVSSLVSWEIDGKFRQLIEIGTGCQILIEYGSLYNKDTQNDKYTYNAEFFIPRNTSERGNNIELWESFKSYSSDVKYPYIYLYHHTEEDKYPLIIKDNILRSSSWNLAGTEQLKISFSYFTDIKKIKHSFDFWPLAMKQKNGISILIRGDDNSVISADIYVSNRVLSRALKLKIDTTLIMPCHIIHHYQDVGEWWEYYFHNIYRIYSNYIKLQYIDDYYLVDANNVEGYKSSKGFMMARGEDAYLIQMLLYERNIYDFF